MKISIVTISLNQSRFIRSCIESILSQRHTDLEYIVVDAGSTDGSREIISEYKSELKWIFEPDKGPADGLNKGFDAATGEIFGYINADDMLLPGALSGVTKAFQASPHNDVIIGHGQQIDEDGIATRKLRSKYFSLYRYALGTSVAVQQSTFFRSNAFENCDGFNVQNRTCWDGELLVDFALSGASIRIANECWGAFRMYPETISGSGLQVSSYLAEQRRISGKILGRPRDWREVLIRPIVQIADILRNAV